MEFEIDSLFGSEGTSPVNNFEVGYYPMQEGK
jgi:hypothetical protein